MITEVLWVIVITVGGVEHTVSRPFHSLDQCTAIMEHPQIQRMAEKHGATVECKRVVK